MRQHRTRVGVFGRKTQLLQCLLDNLQLIAGVVDAEVTPHANMLSVATQDLDANRMEGAHPRHVANPERCFGGFEQLLYSLPHLCCSFVCTCDRQDFLRVSKALLENVCDAVCEHFCFTRTCSSED